MTENIDLKELIMDYNTYLNRVQQGTLIIADNFRQKKNNDGLGSVMDFVEGMNWLIAVSKHLSTNDIVTAFEEQKIVAFLEEINGALAVQDYFLVADLFEYEIAEYFTELPDITINN